VADKPSEQGINDKLVTNWWGGVMACMVLQASLFIKTVEWRYDDEWWPSVATWTHVAEDKANVKWLQQLQWVKL
jgi:hypothetical protein